MPIFVYVLRSETTGRLYIGHTKDVGRRLREHESGQSPSTRRRGPWTLIYSEAFATRGEAMRHERWLKSLKNPARVCAYVEHR